MLRSSALTRFSWLATMVACVVASAAHADARGDGDARDEILAPPPVFKGNGATVVEKLGERIPLDAEFRTQDGTATTLGDVLRGEVPTILTFNYADCPMLCSLQLNGLMAALPGVTAAGPVIGDASGRDVRFEIGKQFRIVSISLEPTETPERASKMRDKYLARLPEGQRAAARDGWTFLVAAPGGAKDIERVANAVGFGYVYIEERAEWAHPAALIFLSTTGTVTRYVYGIEFEPQVLRESIFKAGIAEPSTAVGFMNRCYHYDPSASDHSRAGMMALRVGAAGFVLLLAACFGVSFVRRHARRGRSAPAGEARLS